MIQLVKGTKDIYGEEVLVWQEVEKIMRRICAVYGIGEIRTPSFEFTELFVRGVGETTDIVQKEMYTFTDDGGRNLTLRPEGTAGVARAFIEHGMHNQAQPTKLYYISPSFRCENTQAGRQRQFHQFGVEILGSYSAMADVESISVAWALLQELGLKDVELRLNSLGCSECRAKFNEVLKTFLGDNLTKMCPTCQERFQKNPLRTLDCKEERCQEIVKQAPSVLECLDEECTTHFQNVQKALDGMGISYTIDPKIVRGLDYYTRTVFEFISDGLTVCGGGRYDHLIEQCGGKPTGAVGFGLGIERLVMLLEKANATMETKVERDVYIGSMGVTGLLKAQALTYALRGKGVLADCDTVERGVKAQMKYANKLGVKYAVILGDSELESGIVELKEMESGEKEEVKLEEFIQVLVEKCL
ncbi:MAG: histidine--tRNA ligase [Bacillota bacterium]